jgi:CrcB protein
MVANKAKRTSTYRLSLLVSISGLLGALSRLAISASPIVSHTELPWATLSCNWLGCLLLGWFVYGVGRRTTEAIRTIVATGFLG